MRAIIQYRTTRQVIDMADSQSLVTMKGIAKSFPGVVALENVDFSLRKGEIHALMGENVPGKSTLVKILTGVEHQDKGLIALEILSAKVLILDEPTSSLDIQETNLLFDVMRKLKHEGIGIVFITHFLD